MYCTCYRGRDLHAVFTWRGIGRARFRNRGHHAESSCKAKAWTPLQLGCARCPRPRSRVHSIVYCTFTHGFCVVPATAETCCAVPCCGVLCCDVLYNVTAVWSESVGSAGHRKEGKRGERNQAWDSKRGVTVNTMHCACNGLHQATNRGIVAFAFSLIASSIRPRREPEGARQARFMCTTVALVAATAASSRPNRRLPPISVPSPPVLRSTSIAKTSLMPVVRVVEHAAALGAMQDR